MINTHAELVYPELLINSLNTKAASCFGAKIPKEMRDASKQAPVSSLFSENGD